MALDLNIPPTEDEDDDPFGGLPHDQDHPHPPFVEAYPMGDAYGPSSFDLNMDAQESVHEVDGFSAPTAASNFGLNIHLEQEEAGEDADVYAEDFHVIFAEEELQGSSDHGDQAGAFNAAHGAATFDLNYDFEQEVLDGSCDEEHVPQG
ncbi:unnamed protein product [Urochloa humidicola]